MAFYGHGERAGFVLYDYIFKQYSYEENTKQITYQQL